MSKHGRAKKTFKSFSPVHTTVEEWLEHLDLITYKHLFVKYKSLEDVIKLNDSTLKRLGIKSSADRARMMSSIAILRESRKSSKGFTGSPERMLRLERLKQEACIPRSIYKLMFHSNTALAGPLGIVPSLNLPSTRDLEYVSWYHGVISRLEAESLVMNEGDFLVRNSSSHPGELVLTCCRSSNPLHFVINCLEHHRDGETSEKFYKFDGENFPSVTGLIKFHWDSGKAITEASGAILRNPVASQRKVVTKEVNSVPNNVIANKILSREKWTGSQPLLSLDETPFRGHSCSSLSSPLERYGSMPSMLRSNKDLSASAGKKTLPDSQVSTERINKNQAPTFSIKKVTNPSGDLDPGVHYSNAGNDGGDVYLEPSKIEEHLPPPPSFLLTSPSSPPPSQSKPPPPPKPSRVPTLKFNESGDRPMVKVRNLALYEGEEGEEEEDDDSGGDGDGLKNSEDKSVTNPSDTSKESVSSTSSYFHHLSTHKSSFLPPNNKPLDSTATIKFAILGTHPAVIAMHLTYIDITIFNIVSVKDLSLGVASGLELLTLPQGQTLRQDVIERHHCLRLFVCVTILNCSNQGERCNLISHWLNVAMELKVTTGNIFSFFSIMDALCSSQIVRLKNTWKNLKQLHGPSLEMFETKLLPNYRNLLDASGVTLPYQKNTITPHIYPLLELLERPSMVSEDSSIWKLSSWEMNQPFFGLDVILIHLDTARLITARIHLYKDAAESFLSSNTSKVIPDLLDVLDSKTQVQYLWGAKGALADRAERLAKFDHLLSLLSEKVELVSGLVGE